MTSWWNLIPLTMILAAALALLTFDEWRRDIVALAVLYLGIFIMIVQVMPLTLAAVKLITGWMTTLILALSLPKKEIIRQTGMTANRIFRAFSFGLICVIAFLVSKTIGTSFQIEPEIAFAAIAVFGGGLLHLGMKFHPFSIIFGILIVFAGFEMLYGSLETSVLINGILSAINLLIGLIGTFFAESYQQEDHL